METDGEDLCLICHSKISSTEDKREYFHPPNPKLLSKDLSNYFLLRHVFNLSSDQVQNYLQSSPCPRDWVRVCGDCAEKYVDKCTRIFLELRDVKRCFRAARDELIEAVKRSVEKEGTLPVAPKEALNIPREVRRLVTQREAEVEPDHSFGGSEATKPIPESSKIVTEPVTKPDTPVEVGEDESSDWNPDGGDNIPESDDNSESDSSPGRKRNPKRKLLDSDSTCKYCGKGYHHSKLIRHQNGCSKNPVGTSLLHPKGDGLTQRCDVCGLLFPFKDIFEHVKGHVGDFALRCPNKTCPFVFSNSKPIQVHLNIKCKFDKKIKQKKTSVKVGRGGKTSPSKKPPPKPPRRTYLYKCETCGFESFHRVMFQKHLEQVHERASNKNHTCPMADCEETFTLRQTVDFHLSTHMFRETTFQKCELCSERVPVEQMEEHLTNDHKTEETFSCPHCPFLFSTKGYMVEHLHEHRHLPLFCDICGRDPNFTRYIDLRKHYVSEHQVKFPHLTCTICGKTWGTQLFLRRHVRRDHRATPEDNPTRETSKVEVKKCTAKKYPCDLCVDSSVLYYKRPLFTHKVQVHGMEPLQCKTCGKKYASIEGLEGHEKWVHKEIKDRPCPVPGCGKVLNTEEKLKTHVRESHKEKHVCSECGKSFAMIKNLREHHSIVHLRILPHVCDICGKAFGLLSGLNDHRTMHTGETPYKCDTCGQIFRLKRSFARHLKGHAVKGIDFKPTGRKSWNRTKVKEEK